MYSSPLCVDNSGTRITMPIYVLHQPEYTVHPSTVHALPLGRTSPDPSSSDFPGTALPCKGSALQEPIHTSTAMLVEKQNIH